MGPRIKAWERAAPVAWWILLAIVVTTTITIRLRFLEIPLERDEGEYAYAGQLILEGIPPYTLVYNMKFPGTYAAYALIMSIFGQTIAGIHIGLLIANAATIALLFLLGRRLIDPIAGIAAATSYAVLSVSPSVMGLAGHATNFVVLPALGGVLLLLRPPDRQSLTILLMSGSLLGIGLLMKQPGGFFIVFGGLYLLQWDWRSGIISRKMLARIATFSAGAIAPLGMTCLLLWKAGVFATFWFWTVTYALNYGGLVSLPQGATLFIQHVPGVIGSGWPLWLLAAVGLSAYAWDAKVRAAAGFLTGLFIFAMFATASGLYFREHYFILLLPAICLLDGAATSAAVRLLADHPRPLRWIPLGLFAAALSFAVLAKRDFFFSLCPIAACREIYGSNPFPESLPVAEYVRKQTTPSEAIVVMGSEPQIYFYAHRHSATGYIYMFPLMEPHDYALPMQREMIREIESTHPKFIIFVTLAPSWLIWPQSEDLVSAWFNKYYAPEFTLDGLVDTLSSGRGRYELPYVFDSDKVPVGDILVYKRKAPAESNSPNDAGSPDGATSRHQEIRKFPSECQKTDERAESEDDLGNALLEKGSMDEALSHFQKVLEICPNHTEARNNLGGILLQKGEVDEAIADFREILEQQPNHAKAHNNLGNALLRKGEVDEAIVQYEKTLLLTFDRATAHYNLGNAFSRKGWIDEAIAQYRKAVELKPTHVNAQNNLGNALQQKGESAEAIIHFRKALEADPQSVLALNNLSWILATCSDASLRDGAKAVELARQANQLSGATNAVVLHTLAAALAESRQFSQAITTAQRALELAAAQNNSALTESLRREIVLYQAGTPLHDPPNREITR